MFSGLATSSEKGGDANSHIATTGVPGVFSVGSAFTESDVDIQAGCVHSVARSVVSGIDIAGVIHIDGLQAYSATASDGLTATPFAQFSIGRVNVAGFEAFIDRNGVHLTDQTLGDAVVEQIETTMRDALAAANISVSLVPTATGATNATELEPASAAADSGGLLISFEQLIPQIGEPGQGTPPILTITEVLIGGRRVRGSPRPLLRSWCRSSLYRRSAVVANSSAVVRWATSSVGRRLGSGPRRRARLPGRREIQTPRPATNGGKPFGPTSSDAPLTSKGVPLGWIIVGFLACIVAMGPLLGYARWQLLEGRI